MIYASNCKPIYELKIIDNQEIIIKKKPILKKKSNFADLTVQPITFWF